MKNPNDLTWNQTSDLPACLAVPQPTVTLTLCAPLFERHILLALM